MKNIITRLTVVILLLTAFTTAKGQPPKIYSTGLITIDSLKADRIKRDLLTIPILKAIITFKDSTIQSQRIEIDCRIEEVKTISERRNYLERETKNKTRIIFLKNTEIWFYRIAILTAGYFIIK